MSGLVVLAAGGTGGHLFPAEALSRELIGRGRRVALVTDRRGAAFPVEGVTTYRVPAGRSGPGVAAKVRMAIDVTRGVLAARLLLKKLMPAAVVGFGGYPSLPTMLAACRMKLPTMIHDQNAVLGRANKLLAGRVRRIATCFESVTGLDGVEGSRVTQTGNPVRPGILALRTTHYEPPAPGGALRLLVTGGSQGARIFSRIIAPALTMLPPALKSRLRVSQQVRREDLASVEEAYRDSGILVELKPFFDDMPSRLGHAHLAICRAGGSTVAELTVAGRPAILVPYAAALADEQTANACELVARGGGWLLPERELTPQSLATLLQMLLEDPVQLARAAAESHALGQPAAASALADLVEAIEAEGHA
jgi:UDP-N-acetylglucosamine--N-acetylmuramyl-(pentapeptide) pyrophosphoryl-undecaprenol N-acetylglucosamine transferase